MNEQKLQSMIVRAAEALAVLLAAFVVTVRPTFSALAAPLHLNIRVHLLVFMSAVLVTLIMALRKRLDLRAGALTLLLLAFVATTTLAACFAEYRCAAVVRALDIAAWCVLALVLIQLVSTPFRARILLAALVATLAVLAVNAFHQYFVALPDIRRDLADHIRRMTESGSLEPSLVRAFTKRAETGDVFGTFVTANSFAGYLILLLPAAAASGVAAWRERGLSPCFTLWGTVPLFRHGDRHLRRNAARVPVTASVIAAAVVALVAVAGVVVLALTWSKGGILALALALGLWAALTILGRVRRGTAAAAAAVVFVAALLTAQTVPTGDNAPAPRRELILGDSAEVRIEYWKASWEMFRRHPWLGLGPGNFGDAYVAFRTPEGSETRYAHNDYIETAVEQGLPGVAAFVAIWAAWFLSMRRRAPRGEKGVRHLLPVGPEGACAQKVPDPFFSEQAGRRLLFVVIVGAVGVMAIFFAMDPFIPTAETQAMTFVGLAVWLVVYALQARHALALDPGAQTSPLLKAAVMAGVAAILIHMAIDFDFEEAGITAPLAAMLAVGLGLRDGAEEGMPRPFGTGAQLALVAGVAAPLALVLVFFLYPLIDMSVALEQSRELRAENVKKLAQADLARGQGDLRRYQELSGEARKALTVEYPKRLGDAIRAYPGNTEPHMELARMEAAALRGKPNAGRAPLEKRLDEAKRLSPRDPAPWVLMADVIQSQMKAAQARGDAPLAGVLATAALHEIDGAVERYPTRPEIRLTRARLLDRLGRRGEALDEYRTALDFAGRTSEKELKFTPDQTREIRQAIDRLQAAP